MSGQKRGRGKLFSLPAVGAVNDPKAAGNAALMQQIKEGKTEAEIRKSWEPQLTAFKQIRKKYLLYPDFE